MQDNAQTAHHHDITHDNADFKRTERSECITTAWGFSQKFFEYFAKIDSLTKTGRGMI